MLKASIALAGKEEWHFCLTYEGATVDSCIMKLILANSPMIVLRDSHRPRMPAALDGLSKAQG